MRFLGQMLNTTAQHRDRALADQRYLSSHPRGYYSRAACSRAQAQDRWLRNHYGVGATPIREALSLLTADGLVERLEQRGFRVAEMSDAEFDELLALRCWVEERAVCQAMQKGGKEWEEGIVVARFHLSRTPRIPPDVNSAANIEYERCHRDLPSQSSRPPAARTFAAVYGINFITKPTATAIWRG